MKIDRLIGIISILLQKEKVTAPYLAKKFEVSRRTINRDIETIIQSGIPIFTEQGSNGGISIMEGYAIDRTAFTSSEMSAILTGLQSLDSISGTKQYQQLMDKLRAGTSDSIPTEDSQTVDFGSGIFINLSTYHKSSISKKIGILKEAVEKKLKVQFKYFSPKGETSRKIEPYIIIYWWSSWYIWGFCELRKEFRMFKLNRILDLTLTEEAFIPKKDVPSPGYSMKKPKVEELKVKVCFDQELLWRLIDDFGADFEFTQKDGRIVVEVEITDKISFFHTLLSYGAFGEIVEPKELREEFISYVKKIEDRYCRSN